MEAGRPTPVPRATEQLMLEELEKVTFCDVCILLIEREIEVFAVNEQMSKVNLENVDFDENIGSMAAALSTHQGLPKAVAYH